MNILAIETTEMRGTLALLTSSGQLYSRLLPEEERSAAVLAREMRSIFTEADLIPQDCDAVAVTRGPGSFTGVRVGLATAATFAFATNSLFFPLDTLAVIAAGNAQTQALQMSVAVDAQRGEVMFAEFTRTGPDESFVQATERKLCSGDAWLEPSAEMLYAGPILEKLSIPEGVSSAPEEFWRPAAAVMTAMVTRGDAAAASPFEATPIYSRRSAAEEKAEREKGNA